MTTTIGAFEAKTHFSSLLDRVAAGEQITITRHGTPVARLVPTGPAGSADLADVIGRLQEFSKGQKLDGLKIKELIAEGRQ
jgi:prevent-host-death family protein